jgi:hypothetical protein
MTHTSARTIMPLEQIPDWERRLARQDAFWQREIIDRPVVHITIPKQEPVCPGPCTPHRSVRERWLDADYAAEAARAEVLNTEYLGDALPHVMPYLGPELFSAFFGCDLEFDDETSWSRPNLLEWAQVDEVRFNTDSVYWKSIVEITEAMLQAGQGLFHTSFTDLHPGADAIAAFRDPMQLNLDLVDNPDQVRGLLEYVTDTYLWVYEFFREKLSRARQATCTWANQVSTRRWFIPQSDFSCMVSRAMFQDFFVPHLVRELRHYEVSLYHLDGPGALKHLDTLLEIPELTAIQWVYGAGNGRCSDWLPVYQRIQKAGKGLELRHLEMDELDLFMEHLRPEGVWIGMAGVPDREAAAAVLRKVGQWR